MKSHTHAARAEELAEKAAGVFVLLNEAAGDGGVAPAVHDALLGQMNALTALAQVHATLSLRSN